MVWIAISLAFNSAPRMFWCPGSLSAMCIVLLWLYMSDPAVSPTICPSKFLVGGVNDPSVYIHWWGGYLSWEVCLGYSCWWGWFSMHVRI